MILVSNTYSNCAVYILIQKAFSQTRHDVKKKQWHLFLINKNNNFYINKPLKKTFYFSQHFTFDTYPDARTILFENKLKKKFIFRK